VTCSAGSGRIGILPALGKTLSRCSARRSKKRTGMVVLRAIPMQSLCERQVAPIVGRVRGRLLNGPRRRRHPQAGTRGRGRRSPTVDSVAFDRANCQHHRPGPENQLSSGRERRLIASRTIEVIASGGDNPNALLWSPAGVSPEDAAAILGIAPGTAAVLSGPEIYRLFDAARSVTLTTWRRRSAAPC